MSDATDLPIEQQKLIFEVVLSFASALEALSELQHVDHAFLDQQLSALVKEKISQITDEEITQGVKEFFEANAKISSEPGEVRHEYK